MRNPIRRWIIARAIRKARWIYRCGMERVAREIGDGGQMTAVTAYMFGPQPAPDMPLPPEEMQRIMGELWRRLEANAGRPTSVPPAPSPGRQPIHMHTRSGLFGMPEQWAPIPPNARQAPYEDLHTFPKGGKPIRDTLGFRMPDPALSLICVGCELEQPPLAGGDRQCPYCGITMRLHGTHVFWWREPTEVGEWKP